MGGSIAEKNLDEEYSEIGDGGDVGFLDFEDDKSFNSFNPSDAGPVSISIPFRFAQGKPQSAFVGETSADSIRIQNNTDEPIDLWSIQIFSSNPEGSFVLSLMKPPSANADKRESNAFVGSYALEDRVLQPRQTLTIWLSCKPKEIGLQTSVVHFDVGYEKIERVAFLLADNNVSQTLFSTRPYSRAPIRGKIFDCNNYVTGPRPTRPSRPLTGFRLHQYEIPKEIRELVEARQVPDVVMEGLNAFKYARFFSALINIEEIHLEEQMRAFDMQSVCLKRRASQYLSLEVPGLAEKRPSLVCGDFIFAKLANQDPDRISHPFQGFIHRVEADEILLKFDKNLHQFHRDDHIYNISFTYNRLNMRKLYHAITAAECLGKDLLFPLQSAKQRVISTTPFQPSTPSLNREQIQSVEMIMGCKGFPPYVIHGPPGTGKTLTVVEAILQLYRARKKARILVCAASNFAADHVMEKLLAGNMFGIRESEIFRLNAASRQREDVRPDFIKYCYFDDSSFQCPPLKALQRYRIIISTYMSSASLHAEGIRRGHFSHIFLDEAAQVSEPEAMNPIATLSTYDTVIVLAGDPMQLGPVVYSSTAEELGLGKSYMERLFEFEYYNGGDENYVTKLLRNYRCHPAILELPSKLFYTGELIACKEDNDSSLYDCVNLPNKSFPVLFVGIQGCDEREGNNPSWFNRFEASKVVDFIKNLLSNDELSEADIGVITPYKQQVTKIQKALEFLEKPDIKVGSVEQFQGQERKIIIISTVRSTVKHNNFDRAYCLGFLHNPRRFNVSITRARSLLIIIGNPHIIAKDPYWEKLLRHCVDNGSYQGCPLPHLDKQGFPQHSSAYSYTRDIEEPKFWGVECREDSQQNFKIAEWCEKASTLCNVKNGYHEGTSTKYNDDDERSEHVGKFDEPDPKFIVTEENYPCYNSNEDELGSTDDYSACKDSLIQQCGFTEAVTGNEMPDLDGGDDKDFVPQNNGIEWKGLTFTATGWD